MTTPLAAAPATTTLTFTLSPTSGLTAKPARTAARRRTRRWIRAAIPFAVLLTLWVLAVVAHYTEEPDLSDRGTLSPTGTGRHGSSHLAGLLTERGVTIERVTSGTAAIRAAAGTDATIFMPAPDFVHPAFVGVVSNLGGAHRIVVVRPGRRTMLLGALPVVGESNRWATATVEPRCTTPFAQRAGAAAVLRSRYATDVAGVSCYGGAVVGARVGDTETLVVGATDPFRNDRIAESGNAPLATELLSEHGRVIWVDVHDREDTFVPPPEIDLTLPDYRRGEQDRGVTGSPLIDAFPSGLWAALALAATVALLFALASGRRLGPPVAEPLPVLVPAAEAVTGRGRLYARVRARPATYDALRGAAIRRLLSVIDPIAGITRELEVGAAGPPADAFAAQVASRAGLPVDQVRALLFADAPDDDGALVGAVARLDALVDTVLQHDTAPPSGGDP